MAYYGRRRYNPAAEERREREERERIRQEKQRTRFNRLLEQFRRVRIRGEEAQRAWGQPERRSLYGREGPVAIIRGSGRELFLQQAGPVGWDFYRLVPRYHTPRREEIEGDPRRARQGQRRGFSRRRLYRGET